MEVGLLGLVEVHEAESRQRGRDLGGEALRGCDLCDEVAHKHVVEGAGAPRLEVCGGKTHSLGAQGEGGRRMLQIHLVQCEAPHRGEAGLLVAQGEGDFFAHRGQGYPGRSVVQHDLEAVGLPSLLVGERERDRNLSRMSSVASITPERMR